MPDEKPPFCPEGQCPICGSYIFTKEERKEQVILTRKIVDKIKREKAVKKILEEKLEDIEGEEWD